MEFLSVKITTFLQLIWNTILVFSDKNSNHQDYSTSTPASLPLFVITFLLWNVKTKNLKKTVNLKCKRSKNNFYHILHLFILLLGSYYLCVNYAYSLHVFEMIKIYLRREIFYFQFIYIMKNYIYYGYSIILTICT